MSPHEILLQAQFYLSLARSFERDGMMTKTGQSARRVAAELMALYELSLTQEERVCRKS